MCLSDSVPVELQAPSWVAHQGLGLGSSFCDCGASNLEPPTMGIAAALLPIVTAISLRWWQMRARLRTHDPLCQFGWFAADRVDNNNANMAIPLASLDLH